MIAGGAESKNSGLIGGLDIPLFSRPKLPYLSPPFATLLFSNCDVYPV